MAKKANPGVSFNGNYCITFLKKSVDFVCLMCIDIRIILKQNIMKKAFFIIWHVMLLIALVGAVGLLWASSVYPILPVERAILLLCVAFITTHVIGSFLWGLSLPQNKLILATKIIALAALSYFYIFLFGHFYFPGSGYVLMGVFIVIGLYCLLSCVKAAVEIIQ